MIENNSRPNINSIYQPNSTLTKTPIQQENVSKELTHQTQYLSSIPHRTHSEHLFHVNNHVNPPPSFFIHHPSSYTSPKYKYNFKFPSITPENPLHFIFLPLALNQDNQITADFHSHKRRLTLPENVSNKRRKLNQTQDQDFAEPPTTLSFLDPINTEDTFLNLQETHKIYWIRETLELPENTSNKRRRLSQTQDQDFAEASTKLSFSDPINTQETFLSLEEAKKIYSIKETNENTTMNPNAKSTDVDFFNPFWVIKYAQATNTQIFKIITEDSAKLKDNEGNTLLHLAIPRITYHTQIIKRLLSYKADINAQNQNGQTPLHLASINSRVGAIKLLLLGGASKIIKDKNEKTPALYATSKNSKEAFQIPLTLN